MEPIQSIDAAAKFASGTQGTRPLDSVEICNYYIDIKHGMKISYASVISATEIADTSLPPEIQSAKATNYCTEFSKLTGNDAIGKVKAVPLEKKPSVFLCVQERY